MSEPLTPNAEPVEEWGIVQQMGHVKLAGRLSTESRFGGSFLRIDVPDTPDTPGFTRLIAPGSLYDVTFTSEQIARAVAGKVQARPIDVYELSDLIADRAVAQRRLTARAADPDDDLDGAF